MSQYPRSAYDRVGGIVYFARMLDKIRLKEKGNLPPDYLKNLSIGFDGRCSRFLGVDYPAIVKRVGEGGTDEEILAWCFEKGRKSNAEEILIWNKFMLKRGWRDEDDGSTQELQNYKKNSGLGHRKDLLTFFDYYEVDEKGRADTARRGGASLKDRSRRREKADFLSESHASPPPHFGGHKISLNDKFALIREHWRPKVVAQLNGQELKLVKFEGVFPWHHHENEDEMFLVWRGRMAIEFRGHRATLQAGELCVVPHGVEHRTMADAEAEVLIFEPAQTRNTGNIVDETFTAPNGVAI